MLLQTENIDTVDKYVDLFMQYRQPHRDGEDTPGWMAELMLVHQDWHKVYLSTSAALDRQEARQKASTKEANKRARANTAADAHLNVKVDMGQDDDQEWVKTDGGQEFCTLI